MLLPQCMQGLRGMQGAPQRSSFPLLGSKLGPFGGVLTGWCEWHRDPFPPAMGTLCVTSSAHSWAHGCAESWGQSADYLQPRRQCLALGKSRGIPRAQTLGPCICVWDLREKLLWCSGGGCWFRCLVMWPCPSVIQACACPLHQASSWPTAARAGPSISLDSRAFTLPENKCPASILEEYGPGAALARKGQVRLLTRGTNPKSL